MKSNVCGIDKTGRLTFGVLLIGLALTKVIGPWGFVGVIPVATAVFSFCPLYRLFGLTTCRVPRT
jgi:hypothetical protein